jgi:hypothetical protein
MLKIAQRNRLVKRIREQNDLLLSLQDQLDIYMFRSFPSLGWKNLVKYAESWLYNFSANCIFFVKQAYIQF